MQSLTITYSVQLAVYTILKYIFNLVNIVRYQA